MTDRYTSPTTTLPASISRLRQPTKLFHEFEKQQTVSATNSPSPTASSPYEEERSEQTFEKSSLSLPSRTLNNTTGIRRSATNSNFTPTRRFDMKQGDCNVEDNSRKRLSRKWDTDDELSKPTYRHSLSSNPQPPHNAMEETTTKSLLYLLNKEREKRCAIQKVYESTSLAFRELQQTHNEDLVALESDIQTLQDALRKERQVSLQLNQMLREAHAKFADEMKTWAGKVMEMESQGKELQNTFHETMERLEKEEDEMTRLRAENRTLREQLNAGCGAKLTSRRNLEDVKKVGSMEDHDDISVSTESNKPLVETTDNSDTESVTIIELNERIAELEEIVIAKEKAAADALIESQSIIKQTEEKHEKQVKLLRATIAQSKKTIDDLNQELRMTKYTQNQKRVREEKLQKELEKEKELQLQKEKQLQLLQLQKKQKQQQHQPPQRPLSPPEQQQQPQQGKEVIESNIEGRRHQLSLLNARKASISEKYMTHDRKGSVTSTNSGSIESGSHGGGSVDDKYMRSEYAEGEQSEAFSDEEEDQSSFCTGSEPCVQSRTSEEVAEPAPKVYINLTRSSPRQNHIGDEHEVVDDEMLDAILSDREDRSLPLIGHYSAAEYTEDEDFTLNAFDRVLSGRSRQQNIVGGRGRFRGNTLTGSLSQLNKECVSGGEDGIP